MELSDPQRRVLMFLLSAEKPTTDDIVDHVYRRVRGSTSSVLRIMGKLVAAGVVEHQVDPDDETRAWWIVTNQGRGMV